MSSSTSINTSIPAYVSTATVTSTIRGTPVTIVAFRTVSTFKGGGWEAIPTLTSTLGGDIVTPSPSSRSTATRSRTNRPSSTQSSQAAVPGSAKTTSAQHTVTSSSASLSTAAKAGIGAGIGIVALLAFGLLLYYLRRKTKRRAGPLEIDISDEWSALEEKGDA